MASANTNSSTELSGMSSAGFTGTIPTEFGLLTRLTSMGLNSNSLNGTLPTQIGNMVAMSSYFYLKSNSLSGSIPTEIGAAAFYQRIYLDTNQLSGSVPTELGALGLKTSAGAYFFLDSNRLCDSIPTEVAALSSSLYYASSSTYWDIDTGNSFGTTCGAFDEWPKLSTTILSRCAI